MSPPHPALPSRAAALPAPLTSLVGRDREAEAVRELLRASRLVTVTGAGGSGKTRLALEAARRAAPDFAQGAAWVELAPLADPELLPGAVAAAVGLETVARPATDVLLDALRDRELLLVLDNCEHVVDTCAWLADRLLREAPRLRILATSREALGVGGERAWLIPALSLPGADGPKAAESEAVRLFAERAGEADAGFRLTSESLAAVAQICRRLDGLPLAIELAAARVRALTPAQIAARLDDSFRLLTTGGRTAVPRHRTLREAIDWSHALLGAREQRLLHRLSVFAGDFSLESAEAVCAGDPIEGDQVLDLLAALVDKSLVVMREGGGTARYALLETIRQYGAGWLREAGDADAVAARHAHHYAALALDAEPHLVTRGRRERVEVVRRELDNVRAALVWTRERDPLLHVRLSAALHWVWYSIGLWAEGRRWHEGALALAVAAPPTRERAGVLFGAGAIAALQADTAAAEPWLEEALAIARALGDQRLAAYAGNYLAMALVQRMQPAGETHARAALDWFRADGDLYGQRLALLLLATLYGGRRDVARARAAAEEGVAAARAFGTDRELGIALHVLAMIELQAGDSPRAAAIAREALGHLRRDPQYVFVAAGMDVIGVAECERGRPLAGVRLFGAAEACRDLVGARIFPAYKALVEPRAARARAELGDAAFDAAAAGGRALPLDEALDEVMRAGEALAGEVAPRAAPPALPTAAPGAAPALRVNALGPLEIFVDGARLPADAWRSGRPRELLLYLLCHPEGRTREQLGLDFWPDASATQVKNNFHVTLHHLRKAIGRAELVTFERDRYRVHWELGVELDAATFERDVRAALRRPAGDASAKDARSASVEIEPLRAALACYRGELLAEERVGDWHLELRERLARLFAEGTRALALRLERAERHVEAVEAYRRLVVAEPMSEDAHRRLMLALARVGERGQALRQYDRLVMLLRAELEAEPEPETVALHERLRRAEPV